MKDLTALPVDKLIYTIRGHRVMLDRDLARIYGVTTKRLNQQVHRNLDRFPVDFMFQITTEESKSLRLQIATSKIGRGGRRTLPFAFTEHGAVMLASVLNSPVAVAASIQVVRAFIRIRQMIATNKDFARRLDDLEKKYDEQFQAVFDAIRAIMTTPDILPWEDSKKQVGFKP
jgi:hypothetical protein